MPAYLKNLLKLKVEQNDIEMPCALCRETGHSAAECPELYREINEPSPPQPTGPRGQDEE